MRETVEFVAKAVIVDKLPKGYEKNLMSKMVKEPSLTKVFVVAVNGDIGDWACYIGWPSFEELKDKYRTQDAKWYCENVNSVEDVAGFGDKLSEDSARELFPEYSDRPYRR